MEAASMEGWEEQPRPSPEFRRYGGYPAPPYRSTKRFFPHIKPVRSASVFREKTVIRDIFGHPGVQKESVPRQKTAKCRRKSVLNTLFRRHNAVVYSAIKNN